MCLQMIPYGEQAGIPCTVGKQPQNIPKNRFKTTFPCMLALIMMNKDKAF